MLEDEIIDLIADKDNDQLSLAAQLIETTGANLFLTGKAGTGKTTFLRRLREKSNKRIVVLAPTGIAAINAGGMTIHSFFQLNFGPFIPGIGIAGGRKYDRFSREKKRVIRTMDLLVIDEISMVRADLLDAIDFSLRRHRNPDLPFGGVQLLLIGDLAQLPPVVKDSEWELLSKFYASPYFFSSLALAQTQLETIELSRVYRQEEGEFLEILNRIRDNKVDYSTLNKFNQRHIPNFKPADDERWIRLVTHNYQAREINERQLQDIPGDVVSFQARITGDFPESSFPADSLLELKVGAQVMFIKNDPSGTGEYYNGLLGRITSLSENEVHVLSEDGHNIKVGAVEWENNKYEIDDSTNQIKEVNVGSFFQIPLRKAWAITIHKSQGLTFDRAIIDASSSFAHGQTYVALSRCRTLNGLVLERPLQLSSLICDHVVVDYMHQCNDNAPDSNRIASLRDAYHLSLLDDLFNFKQILFSIESLNRLMDESLLTQYPAACAMWRDFYAKFNNDVCKVSSRFKSQYTSLLNEENSNLSSPIVDNRIRKGANYFVEFIMQLLKLIPKVPVADLDNKVVKKRLSSILEPLRFQSLLKMSLLDHVSSNGMVVSDFMKFRAKMILILENNSAPVQNSTPAQKKTTTSSSPSGKKASPTISDASSETKNSAVSVSTEKNSSSVTKKTDNLPDTDIHDPHLYRKLKAWRLQKSGLMKCPAFVIMSNATMINIVNAFPKSIKELAKVKGVGPKFLENHGEEILDLLTQHSDADNPE